MIKAALVGAGGIAGSHVQAIGAHADRVRLAAAMDVDATRLAEFCAKHGIPSSYTDLAAMLDAERPDLVCIATPPFLHAEQAIQSLDAGAWVWCEKPLCSGLADLDRIEEAERRSGRFCSSVVQWRFGSAGRHVKRLIDEGALGRPLVGLCQTTWFRDAAYYRVPWRGRWSTEVGGATMGQGIHAIDLFRWLLGDWEEVVAMAGTLDREIEVEDASMATVRFASGALGNLVTSVLCPRQETYLRLDLQRATVECRGLYGYDNANWTYTAAPGVEDTQPAGWASVDGELPSGHAAQLRVLLDHLERGERPPASIPDVRPTFELLSALYRSAATAQAVRRGEIVPGDPYYEHVAGAVPRAPAETA
jgi:predicted dehydrogenase